MKRAALFIVLLLALPASALAEDVMAQVSPEAIDIGALYNGTSIAVSGLVPEGSQVALRFTGAPEEVRMKQKGKFLGLLWMNMNTLHFSGVPKVCLVESTAPLGEMGEAGGKLSLTGMAQSIGIEPAGADRGMLLPELLKLKRGEGLYRESSGAIVLGAARGAAREFSANVSIPSRLSPGSYVVEIFAVKDGRVVAQGVKNIEAKLVGIPAQLADLAFNHGALYGIFASIIAILAGLAIGIVFQSKEAH
ncbi:MAG: TIGR02186 family protein [Desulfovibrionaceae bacterium]|nr:TIGR02186 family protein [Desulfovibrionaceae bacterium]MBF0513729.1 TIGR02186 family protein [Desulfovibrionaceae bacterium]